MRHCLEQRSFYLVPFAKPRVRGWRDRLNSALPLLYLKQRWTVDVLPMIYSIFTNIIDKISVVFVIVVSAPSLIVRLSRDRKQSADWRGKLNHLSNRSDDER